MVSRSGIAVLGMGCRLPGRIHHVDALWSALCDGVDAVTTRSVSLWHTGVEEFSPNGAGSVTGGFLENVLEFDPGFFAISPREAVNIDPQHRLLLETTWEALEHANLAADALAGSATGVFVGMGGDDYTQLATAPGRSARLDPYSVTGVNRGVAAGRLSYLLKTHGPALTVDTTCSSSLVAVHLAMQSLAGGESDLAIAAGAHLVRTPWSIAARRLTNALSPTGRCRAFDAEADGFVLGEGVVTLVLKRLDDALRDEDPILGVIHGSAMNHDGPSSGLTAPNGRAQEAVLRSALRAGGIDPLTVGYVEAHGTGTSLGDPIEAEALAAVYGRGRPPAQPLAIGSLKTNLGHLEAAAGIASLVKALLVVGRGALPPTLHHRTPSPHVDWARAGLRVQTELQPWNGSRPRRAGVSAFGLSGTNCHLVVGEPPEPERRRARNAGRSHGASSAVFALSARDEPALRVLAERCAQALERSTADLDDVCVSVTRGRSQMRSRLALVTDSVAHTRKMLSAYASGGEVPGLHTRTLSPQHARVPVLLVLPAGVNRVCVRRLYEGLPSFRHGFDRVVDAGRRCGVITAATPEEFTDQTGPVADFAVRHAVGAMWTAWGLGPDVIVAEPATGWVAHALAGGCSLEEALAAVSRGAASPSSSLSLPPLPSPELMGPAVPVVVSAPRPDDPETGDSALVRALASAGPDEGPCLVLQVGGGVDLAGGLPGRTAAGVRVVTSLTGAGDGGPREILQALPELFVAGHSLNWDRIATGARTVRLPGHPFRRHRLLLPGVPEPVEPDDHIEGGDDEMGDQVTGIRDDLRVELARLLAMAPDRVSEVTPLLELGADSLVLAAVVQFVKDRFGAVVSVRQLFEEARTIDDIACRVAKDSGSPSATVSPDDRPGPDPVPPVSLVPPVAPVARSAGEDTPSEAEAAVAVLQAQVRALTAQLAELRAAPALQAADGDAAAGAGGSLPARAPAAGAGRAGGAPVRRKDPEPYIADVMRRYHARTSGSREHVLRHQDRLANNRRFVAASNPVAAQTRYPIFSERSEGSRIWDCDGNEYLDLSMGFGAHLLGHNPPAVMRALKDQLAEGIQLGSASRHAGEVAELVGQITGMERMFFCVSGTEAVMTALRIARAATGRSKVVIFSKAYHGHFDGTLVTAGADGPGSAGPMVAGTTRGMVEDVLLLPFDRADSLEVISARGDEIAAVVVEPVPNGDPGVQAGRFLADLREVTRRSGTVLVFDEVLTGFRLAPGGGQELFGVRADLVAYGKCLAAGLPMAAVAGSREYIDLVDAGSWFGEPRVPSGRALTYTAGTYANHPLALVAARAVLGQLADQGPRLQEGLNARADRMLRGLADGFARAQVPVTAPGLGSFFRFAQGANLSYTLQPMEMDLFRVNLALRGVYVAETGASFLSTRHTEEDAQRVVAAAIDAAEEMRDAGLWEQDRRSNGVVAPHRAGTFGPAQDVPQDAPRHASGFRTRERERPPDTPPSDRPEPASVELSLSYFGDSTLIAPDDHYRLLLDGADFADANGLAAVWLPERHFHAFGGFSPNPAVLASALAVRTERVGLRAGSVVAPLHHPARIAEEWALVDRLSGGRAGIAFASGWNDTDFVLAPGTFADRRTTTLRRIDEVRRLWRGEEVEFPDGDGASRSVGTHPRPLQSELPVWLTTLGGGDAFAAAGRIGAGVLTNLLSQDVAQLRERIRQYRQGREEAQLDPAAGRVSVLLHTLIGDDAERARAAAAGPLERYLQAAVDLTARVSSGTRRLDLDRLADDDRDYLVRTARDKFLRERALIGDVSSGRALVAELADSGVDEVACFVDFGVSPDLVREGFDALNELRPSPVAAPLQRPVAHLSSRSRGEETGPAAPDVHLPTTPNQQLVWAAAQLGDEASIAYNLRRVLRLVGDLDLDSLRAAFQDVVNRHEALRAGFTEDGLGQRIGAPAPVDLPLTDLCALDEAARARGITQWLDQEGNQAFDLATGPLIRAGLLKESADTHLLCLTVHHVVADGTAEGVVMAELGQLYDQHRGRGAAPAPAPRLADHLGSPPRPARTEDLEYWQQQFTPMPPPLTPAGAGSGRSLAGHTGRRMSRDLPEEVLGHLQTFGAAHNASPFMLLLAAFTWFLHHETSQDDLVVGIPVSRRSVEGPDARLVAYCANLLPIRSRRAAGPSGFVEHLGRVRRTMLDAFDHEACSLAEILRVLPRRERWGRPSVINAVLTWDRVVVPAMAGLRVQHVESPSTAVRFDLGLNIAHHADGHRITWEFNTSVFTESEVLGLHDRFMALLPSLTAASPALAPDGHPEDGDGLLALIQHRATRQPSPVVLDFQGVPLDLSKVVARARALAARLQACGVRPGEPVGLRVGPGHGLLVGLLGILWSGGLCRPGEGAEGDPPPRTTVGDRSATVMPGTEVVPLDTWVAGVTAAPAPRDPQVPALALPDGQVLSGAQLDEALEHPVGATTPAPVPGPDRLPERMADATDWLTLLGVAAGRRLTRPETTAASGLPQPQTRPDRDVEAAERRMADIWDHVLQREGTEPDQDFFELGGDSLRAIRILARVRTGFGRRLPVDVFFTAPTVRELTQHALGRAGTDGAVVTVTESAQKEQQNA
ncbi:MupA/Atu3671 family FMN-dependent luciferase-like monooxygenase [Kineosporia sp. NBRC 101731]|uniref:MupA/Atu3671 family FMN-dependent luciferase-like monooxygenase n=1 Tax=Kineosporia sp. NBRC 101731 TaxID=3032199 RepID=UPI0024A37DF9|nr:MupA/Atu3671 family FMN-dependent luciferase-like monooxygenase [Kineosporia sp. NBRC 101731]GLY30839.1 hypothetical protein Kisp02_42040 [Kineosporia sp. NBRC 101731]